HGTDLVEQHTLHRCTLESTLGSNLGKTRSRSFVDHLFRFDAAFSRAGAPARAASSAGSDRMREKPAASAALHSPAASPYTPRDAALSENGDETPVTKLAPVRSSKVPSPLTRSCERSSSASASRHAGSTNCPSCTQSPYITATASFKRCWRC